MRDVLLVANSSTPAPKRSRTDAGSDRHEREREVVEAYNPSSSSCYEDNPWEYRRPCSNTKWEYSTSELRWRPKDSDDKNDDRSRAPRERSDRSWK